MNLNRPRQRTILLIVNLLVLVIPLAGIGVLRIYETELLRRTEAELISQVALIEAQYREALRQEIDDAGLTASLGTYGLAVEVKWPENVEAMFRPIPIDIDLSREVVHPAQTDPEPPRGAIDPLARRVGARHEAMLLDAQKVTLSGMRIMDTRGNVVASTSPSERHMSVFHHAEVQRALDGEVAKILRRRRVIPEAPTMTGLSRDASLRIFIAIPVVLDGRVVGAVAAWRTPISLLKGIYDNRLIFGGLLALILLAALTVTGLTSFYIGRPIRHLIDQTERIAHGEASAQEPIKKPGTFEIQQLSQAMAEMARTLDNRALYIKTFARNVSHEFKTPLTAIRGTVELLQDHIDGMEPEERDNFLAILDADAHRLERLVGRLLELARADVQRPTQEALEIGPVLEAMAESARDEDFDIELEVPDASVGVLMENEVLESILSNFFVNSKQHGASTLAVAMTTEDGSVSITMSDDGPGISEGNASKIFDEFFTTARDTGGTGLGLSIVRVLVEAHGGRVEFVPSEDGATFRLTLPTA
ncbi:MAG: ATP-binding protein [Bradymonadaceae bacterium]